MPLTFKTRDGGDRYADDRRTALRYLVTRKDGAFVAWIIDRSDIDHPVRMATVPLPATDDVNEVERIVARHADGIARRFKSYKAST